MKLFGKYLLLLSCVCFSAACDKEKQDGPPPFMDFCVCVVDAETGADLLDPEVEGNIVSDRIRMDIDGESYYVKGFHGLGRYNLFWGGTDASTGLYYLVAIPFYWDQAKSGVLDWGDGTQNTFVYLPSRNIGLSLWIDGVKCDGNVAIIRK